MTVILTATISPKEGLEEEVLDVIRTVIPRVHAESGCEKYALHLQHPAWTPEGTPVHYVVVEKWASDEALEAHRRGEPLAETAAALAGKLARPMEVHRLEAHPVGTDAQGVL